METRPAHGPNRALATPYNPLARTKRTYHVYRKTRIIHPDHRGPAGKESGSRDNPSSTPRTASKPSVPGQSAPDDSGGQRDAGGVGDNYRD